VERTVADLANNEGALGIASELLVHKTYAFDLPTGRWLVGNIT
jgi:hypothetical protein